jgi:hypothetical protein
MKQPNKHSSCLRLSRASTSFFSGKDMDGRVKPGHDGVWKLVLAFAITVAGPIGLAAAHPSIVPHDHPHAASLLPDLAALLMAAVVVGTGVIVIAKARKAEK